MYIPCYWSTNHPIFVNDIIPRDILLREEAVEFSLEVGCFGERKSTYLVEVRQLNLRVLSPDSKNHELVTLQRLSDVRFDFRHFLYARLAPRGQ